MCRQENTSESELSELELKTEEEIKAEEQPLIKKKPGRPRIHPIIVRGPMGRPKKKEEDKKVFDNIYFREYYRNKVSQNIVSCPYCKSCIQKAKLHVHQRSKTCQKYQQEINQQNNNQNLDKLD